MLSVLQAHPFAPVFLVLLPLRLLPAFPFLPLHHRLFQFPGQTGAVLLQMISSGILYHRDLLLNMLQDLLSRAMTNPAMAPAVLFSMLPPAG